MTYRIVNARDHNKYLRSEIDSGGMSVTFVTGANHADDYQSADAASAMISRCQERYPETLLIVVEEST